MISSVEELAAGVVSTLDRRRLTLATAESVTGGLIGAALTSVPGASRVYRGGVISYATELKNVLAGVPESTLDTWGPVAAETVAEMARGVASMCRSDLGLAVTGVAGPDPQDAHPVGQVFIGFHGTGSASPRYVEHRFAGDRAAIRDATVRAALALVLHQLAEHGSQAGGRPDTTGVTGVDPGS